MTKMSMRIFVSIMKKLLSIALILIMFYISIIAIIFLFLPAPTMDIVLITKDIPAQNGFIDENDCWHFFPMELKTNTVCVVRREITAELFGDNYIELLTDGKMLVYIKDYDFQKYAAESMRIVRFRIPVF